MHVQGRRTNALDRLISHTLILCDLHATTVQVWDLNDDGEWNSSERSMWKAPSGITSLSFAHPGKQEKLLWTAQSNSLFLTMN